MFFTCIHAESRKLGGGFIRAVFLLLPLASALYGTFNYLQNLGVLHEQWYSLWSQHTLFYALFFFGPLVGIYAAYLWRLEHLGHNWNLILTLPVPRVWLFLAKLAAVAKMVLLTQLWVYTLYVVCGKLWAGLPGWPPPQTFFWLVRGALAGLAVAAVQLLLAMVIRSFAVPPLLALGGGIFSVLLINAFDAPLWWPYALVLLGMNSNQYADALAGLEAAFVCAALAIVLLAAAAAALLLTGRDAKAS